MDGGGLIYTPKPLKKPVPLKTSTTNNKPTTQQQNTNYNSGISLRDTSRTPSVKTEAVNFDDGDVSGESDEDDIGDKTAVTDNDSLQIDENEEVTGKVESSNVGTVTRIDIGDSDDKTIPLIYDGFENNISEIFRAKASAFGQVIKGDELLDSGLNAIDKMAEGRAVHTYIEIEIQKHLLSMNVTLHKDKTIGVIADTNDSRLRPDLVIVGNNDDIFDMYIYEIKPDSRYGHLTGPAQLAKYQTELNERNQNAVIGSHPGVEAWVTENPTIEVNGKKYNLTLQNGLILYKKVSENKPSNPVGIPVIIPDSSPQEQEDKRNVPSMIQVNRDLAFGMALSGAMGLTVGIFGMNSFVSHDLRMR